MSEYTAANWYWQIGDDTTQFWSSAANAFVPSNDSSYATWAAFGNVRTKAPGLAVVLGVIVKDAGILDASDTTMLRVAEAVALGLTSWTATDVVAWVNYRRTLRGLATEASSATEIPTKPAYPTGT